MVARTRATQRTHHMRASAHTHARIHMRTCAKPDARHIYTTRTRKRTRSHARARTQIREERDRALKNVEFEKGKTADVLRRLTQAEEEITDTNKKVLDLTREVRRCLPPMNTNRKRSHVSHSYT